MSVVCYPVGNCILMVTLPEHMAASHFVTCHDTCFNSHSFIQHSYKSYQFLSQEAIPDHHSVSIAFNPADHPSSIYIVILFLNLNLFQSICVVANWRFAFLFRSNKKRFFAYFWLRFSLLFYMKYFLIWIQKCSIFLSI